LHSSLPFQHSLLQFTTPVITTLTILMHIPMSSVISKRERQSQSHAEEEGPKLSDTLPELPPLTSPTTANAPQIVNPGLYPLTLPLPTKAATKAVTLPNTPPPLIAPQLLPITKPKGKA
jgi:hypothetical protein